MQALPMLFVSGLIIAAGYGIVAAATDVLGDFIHWISPTDDIERALAAALWIALILTVMVLA